MKFRYIFLFISLFIVTFSFAQHPNRTVKSSNEIFLELKKLAKPVRVLYVAAHPDDENTRVISWLENYKNVETAYFSFTRGDGGQNLIGTEKGPLLGILRTQELLEARKIDGGQQFFSHAIDFGYSKNPEETMAIWNEDLVLGDLVYAIRYFKPDVIITRFPPNSQAGHGHHSASAILAEKAFDISGDPSKYPEQLTRVKPWKALRLAWNSYTWRRDPKEVEKDVLIHMGQGIPLKGLSSGEIASQARSMHKCQGFGRAWDRGDNKEYFKYTKGATFSYDILEGINASWTCFPETIKVDRAFQNIIRNYNFQDPKKNINGLVAALKELKKAGETPHTKDAIKKLESLIIASSQLYVEAVTNEKSVCAGDSLSLAIEAIAFEATNVYLEKITLSTNEQFEVNTAIGNNTSFDKKITIHVPENTHLTTPYWLSEDAELGIYNYKDLSLLEQAESKSVLWANFTVQISSEVIEVKIPIYHKRIEPDFGEVYEPLPVLSPVLIDLKQNLHIGINGAKKTIAIEIKNNSKKEQIRNLGITVPKGWSIDQDDFMLRLAPGKSETIQLSLQAAENAQQGFLKFYWKNNPNPALQLQEVNYDHIMRQYVQLGANIKLSSIQAKTTGGKIGYIPGAGDEIAEILGNLGYTVVEINESNWNYINLSDFKTIVTGVRAYNTQNWLAEKAEELWEYAKNGGNVVVQYNTLNFLSNLKAPIAPSELKLGRNRVTLETAPITILNPKHAVLNTPNKITEVDFENWVQERGLYFAESWSKDFEAIFEMNDPNEDPSQGSLLIGTFGKGHISYCGISFFRQLPAGVPGAYRLFVNLVELK